MAFALAVAGAIALGTGAPQAERPREQTLSFVNVEGSHVVLKDPDTATLTFESEADGDTGPAAQGAAAAKMNLTIEALKAAGVLETQLWTSRASLQPIHEDSKEGRSDGPRRVIGYRAENQIKVELHRVDGLGPIIDRGIAAGAASFTGPYFTLAEQSQAQDEVIAGAVANARRRAEAIAKALGMRLGEVIEAGDPSVSGGGGTSYFSAPSQPERIPETPIVPERVSVSARIGVKWRLEK